MKTALESARIRGPIPLITTLALAVAALCDVPSRVTSSGGLSGSAALSVALGVFGVVSLPALLKKRIGPAAAFLPFVLFAIWAIALAAMLGTNTAGFQNLTIFWLFATVGTLTALYIDDAGAERVRRWLVVVACLVAAGYTASLLINGLGAVEPVGRRGFGLEALVLMAMLIPVGAARGKLTRALPWVLFLLIVASLSRTAMVAAGLLLAVRASQTRSGLRLYRFVALLAGAVAGMFWAVENLPVLQERFTGGDQAFQIGGYTIASQGRNNLWGVVWDNVGTAPILGHGPGSASDVIRRNIPGQTEPHNDYLRILHDTGTLGLALFIVAIVALLVATARRSARSTTIEEKAPHLGAFLALMALCVEMLTDNALIYSFVMAPLAVIVGLSLSKPLPAKRPRPARSPRQSRDQVLRMNELARLQLIRTDRPTRP